MRKLNFILIAMLISGGAAAEGIVVVKGKAYGLSPITMKDCSSSAHESEMVQNFSSVALTIREQMAIAYCKIRCETDSTQERNCDKYCEQNPEQLRRNKEYVVLGVFSELRKFPPAETSKFCRQGREACETWCSGYGPWDSKKCIIGCNQYELYNPNNKESE